MRSTTFVLPGPIARTGGYIYDERMIDGLRAAGWRVGLQVINGVGSHLSRTLAAIADGEIVVIDGLALGMAPDAIEAHASRLRIVALVHLPLAADLTRDADEVARIEPLEGRALAAASMIVVTSAATLPMLERYALRRERIVVVEPGADRSAMARGSVSRNNDSRPHFQELLCVATINAGKGHDLLIRALARVPSREWHLTCAGSLTRDPSAVERVRQTITAHGLDQRVSLAGELDADALAACYDRADLFVLATRQETYGMAVAEALAHGLPVISTRTGAIPTLVGDDAGIIVPPDDETALVQALASVMTDPAHRERLVAGARARRDTLPGWEQQASTLSAALSTLDIHG